MLVNVKSAMHKKTTSQRFLLRVSH